MGQSDRIHYHYGAVLPLRTGKNVSDQQYSGAGIIRLTMVVLSIYGLRTGIEGKIPFSWKSLKAVDSEEVCWA